MTEPAAHHRPGMLTTGAVLGRIVADLATRYAGVFSRQTVAAVVEESYRMLAASARVTDHLSALTARLATDRPAASAHIQGVAVSAVPEVLFVCVHNAGRSQMAAALLDHHGAGKVHVRSAGSDPTDQINPAVIAVMAEIGLDLSQEFPKPLSNDVVEAADVVITMGCGDACPIYPGKRYLDWALPDPAGLPVEQIRPIRDDIDNRVRALLNELAPASTWLFERGKVPSLRIGASGTPR